MRNVVSGLKSASLFLLTHNFSLRTLGSSFSLQTLKEKIKVNPPRNGFHVLGKRKSRSDGGWNTHRKPVGALLSHCAVAPRVTLWTQTAASLSSLLQGLKTHLSGAATLLLPSRHLIPAFRLCRPCQEFPVQNSE